MCILPPIGNSLWCRLLPAIVVLMVDPRCLGETFNVKDAVSGWNKLDQCYSDQQCRVTISTIRPGEASEYFDYKFNALGTAFRCEWSKKGDSAKHIACTNSKYGFSLLDQSGDGKWTIEKVSASRSKSREAFKVLSVTSPATTAFMYDVRQLVTEPSFRITEYSTIGKEGAKAVCIRFSADYSHKRVTLAGGELIVMPDRNWAIESYRLHCQFADGKSDIVGQYSYGDNIGDCPMPTKHYYRISDEGTDTPLLERTVSYFDWSRGTIDDKACRLAAFGLPEFEYGARNNKSYWVAANVFIVLLLAAAIYLRRAALPAR